MIIFRFIKNNLNKSIFTFLGLLIVSTVTVFAMSYIKKPNKVLYDSATSFAYLESFSKEETTILETTILETTIAETTVIETTTKKVEKVEETTSPPVVVAKQEIIETAAPEDKKIEKPKEEFVVKEIETKQIKPITVTTPIVTDKKLVEVPGVFFGVDVSYHQSGGSKSRIDWSKVKAAGYSFAMIRVGYRGYETGIVRLDTDFYYNIENALANGIMVGIYFFSQAVNENEAKEEADFVLKHIKNYKINYPVTFDWERVNPSVKEYSRSRDYFDRGLLTKSTFNKITDAFLGKIKNAGYTPMVYGSRNDWKNKFDSAYLTAKYKTWLAIYYSDYPHPNFNTVKAGYKYYPVVNYPYQMWQFTSKGSVPGISGNVDVNVAFFSYAGTDVPSVPISLTVENKSLFTLKENKLNLLTGVKAINSARIDITKDITYSIEDSNKKVILESEMYKRPGTYSIIYTVKDFTGASVIASATILIWESPSISSLNDSFTYNFSADELKDTSALLSILKSDLVATDSEKNNISSSLSFTNLDLINFSTPDNYIVKVTVIDSKNITTTIDLIITIESMNTSEDTSITIETTTDSETTTNIETTINIETT